MQEEPLRSGEDIAVITTNFGEIKLRFFPSEAPKAVENFTKLAGSGYYNGKSISEHYSGKKSIDKILLSGEKSEESRDNGFFSAEQYKREISYNLWHFTGAVAFLGGGHSDEGRFFITGSTPVDKALISDIEKANYPKKVVDAFSRLGGRPEWTFEYTIFAQVADGQDTVDEIISCIADGRDAVIEKVIIVKYEPELHEF